MRLNFFAGIFLVIGILGCFPAEAVESTSPIGIGIFPPIQIPSTDYGITGLRIGVVSVNRATTGIDLGILGNITRQSFKGCAIAGLFNYTHISAEIFGFQIAALANINGDGSNLYGVQIALYNRVTIAHGIQLGLINVAHELHGIQIGLINFNDAGPFKVSPLINAAF